MRERTRRSLGGMFRAHGRALARLGMLGMACVALSGCARGSVEVRFGDAVVNAEVADDPVERFRGLQGHELPGDDEGMLFVWAAEDTRTFALKEVGYSLDVIFMDSRGRVVGLGTLEEGTSEVVTGAGAANCVLEVPAGFIDRHAVEYGDSVVIDGLD